MKLLWFCIVLGAVLELSSGITYNEQVETNSSFACYTEVFKNYTKKPKAIKLFLLKKNLQVICHLYDINKEDTKENRRKNLLLYTSAGLAPSIQIFNSTYSQVFYFQMMLGEDVDSWSIDIPREQITYNTDIAPIEEWFVKFNMHHGLNMFTTEGTLLDVAREPILQWMYSLGVQVNITETISKVINVTITKSPCASDAAIIGLIYGAKVTAGIIIGITNNGFMTRDTVWHNMTETICAALGDDCSGLALVDIILINTRLIMLTTLGLFISEDLRYTTGELLKFKKPVLCGFEMDDYFRARIWYNRQCLANREHYEVDYVGLSFNKDKTLSQESTCFYSNDSFIKWHNCLPHRSKAEKQISRRVVSFIVDYEQNTGIAILSQQNKALVSVHSLISNQMNKKRKFPGFWFRDRSFIPFGMFFHPNSHFLYVYGNQVWLSVDGGNFFSLMIKLDKEMVVKADTCVYTQAIVFVTNKGNIFYTKAGLRGYARLTSLPLRIFSMYFDHLGILNSISPNNTFEDQLAVSEMDVNTLLKEDDLGFNGGLSAQYITEEQMILLNHQPLTAGTAVSKFSSLHVGKTLVYGPGGSGIIIKVFHSKIPPEFVSGIRIDILDRFPVETKANSPSISNSLTILPPDAGTTKYKLQLTTAGTDIFVATDVEKTVVIPGSSSIFITEIVDDLNALGDATMPNQVLLNEAIPSGQWFLFDFGTKNGRKWRIIVDTCRYTIQQFDELPLNAIEYLDLGSQVQFTFQVTPVNTAYQVFHLALMKVIVGRPSLLEVNAEDYWDDNYSYIININVQSKFFEQGKSTIAVIITYASLLCDVTTIVLTLKNSCSYLKTMHYVLPIQISETDWLSEEPTEHNASFLSKVLKKLPVNYRPPSELGIAVPLTENFYNADPSKPRQRDYFEGSKATGRYKQCANKSTRAECGCTTNMKLSFAVAFSDCREKVLRMKFPVTKLPLYFTIKEEGDFQNLTSPYFITITELNNRTKWRVSGINLTSSTLKMKKYLESQLKTQLYNPDGLTITITGSELFHFRVSTIPGVSFCNLFDEFQIYVDDSPLAFPGQYLISTFTAVLIGGIIFVAFILHVYEIQIGNILKGKLKRNKVASKVSVSTGSVSSSETN